MTRKKVDNVVRRTPVEEALRQEDDRLQERANELARTQHSGEHAGSDKQLPANRQHDYTSEAESRRKNFDEKVYLFPESFNALRREMQDYWPVLFTGVIPGTNGKTLGWCMAFDAPEFIAHMNDATNLSLQMDSDNVDFICKSYLNALRKLRGVSSL